MLSENKSNKLYYKKIMLTKQGYEHYGINPNETNITLVCKVPNEVRNSINYWSEQNNYAVLVTEKNPKSSSPYFKKLKIIEEEFIDTENLYELPNDKLTDFLDNQKINYGFKL